MNDQTNTDAPATGVIKTPVRYDSQQKVIRAGEFGDVILEFPRSLTFSDEHVKRLDAQADEHGSYIATCINEHSRLEADLSAAKREIERLNGELKNRVIDNSSLFENVCREKERRTAQLANQAAIIKVLVEALSEMANQCGRCDHGKWNHLEDGRCVLNVCSCSGFENRAVEALAEIQKYGYDTALAEYEKVKE